MFFVKCGLPNSLAILLFAILFTSIVSITSAELLKKCKAAILKSSTPARIALCKVIIARYNVVLDQSEYAYLY